MKKKQKKTRGQIEHAKKQAVKKALELGYVTKKEVDKHCAKKGNEKVAKKNKEEKLSKKKPRIIYGLNTNAM
jgi:hypothetical protein